MGLVTPLASSVFPRGLPLPVSPEDVGGIALGREDGGHVVLYNEGSLLITRRLRVPWVDGPTHHRLMPGHQEDGLHGVGQDGGGLAGLL